MKNKFLKIFIILTLVTNGLVFILPNRTFAETPQEKRCRELREQFQITGGTNVAELLPRYCTVNEFGIRVIRTLLGIAAGVAVLFIIIGGFRYVLASGNEEHADKAKKTIAHAVLGLVIIILSFAIVTIIVNTLTGNIPTGSGSGTGNGDGGGEGNGEVPAVVQDIVNAMQISKVGEDRISVFFSLPYNSTNKAAYDEELRRTCGGVAPVLFLESNGTSLAQASILDSNNVFRATINPTKGLPDTNNVVARICLTEVKTATINLSTSLESATGQANIAAAQIKYSATPSNGNTEVVIKIFASPSDPNVKTACQNLSPTIEVKLNGISQGLQSFPANSILTFPYNTPVRGEPNTQVFLCGIPIEKR